MLNNNSSIIHIWQSSYPPEIRVGKVNETLAKRGHEVTVICKKNNSNTNISSKNSREVIVEIEKSKNIFTRMWSLPFPGNPVWTRAIKKEIIRTNAHIIIVRDIPLFYNAKCAQGHSKVKIILDMAEHYPAAMRSWKKYNSNPFLKFIVTTLKIPDKFEKYAVNNADHILVVCDEQKERLIKVYECIPEKITVVRNTPDISKPHFLNLSMPQPRRKEFWIGYHGILCADRQLDCFIKGFSLALQRQKNIRLLIAGGGETENDLRTLSKKLNLDSYIKFTGRYKPHELPQLYASCSAGIVSLEKNDFTMHTLANKFFDYAALKMPFLYTDLKPLTNVMKSMQCGVGYEAGNEASICESILKLYDVYMNDTKLYEDMGRAGRSAVETVYNWSEDSKRLVTVIDKINS